MSPQERPGAGRVGAAIALCAAAALFLQAATVFGAKPVVRITSGPPSFSSSATATFTFEVDAQEHVGSVVCLLDQIRIPCDVAWSGPGRTAGSGRADVTGLGEGDHQFSVRVEIRPGKPLWKESRSWLVDLTRPVLHDVSMDIVLAASAADGATVGYELPWASDNLDTDPDVSCAPASGSRFPVGSTTITCSATDASGNVSTARFRIDVYPLVEVASGAAATVAGVLDVSGIELVIPAGAFPEGARISILPVENPGPSTPTGSVGPTFEIVSDRDPQSRVEMRVRFDQSTEGVPDEVMLGWWSEDTESWRTVPTDFDASESILVARIEHFSFWSWLMKAIVGWSAERPACDGTPPAWAEVHRTAAGEYGIAASCAGQTVDGLLQVRVQSSHAGASYVRFQQRPDRVTLAGVTIELRQDGLGWYQLLPDGAVLEADFGRPTTTFAARVPLYGYGGQDGISYVYDTLAHLLRALPLPDTRSLVLRLVVDCYPQITSTIANRSAARLEDLIVCLTESLASTVLDDSTQLAIVGIFNTRLASASIWLNAAKALRDFGHAAFAAGAAPPVIDATVTTLAEEDDDGETPPEDGGGEDGDDPAAVTSFSAGNFHTCVAGSDHRLRCAGDNNYGQTGRGSPPDAPLRFFTWGAGVLEGVVSHHARGNSTCAARNDGSVWCWGSNQVGELGLGYVGAPYPGAPMRVVGVDDAVFVGGGMGHNCAVSAAMTLSCWGLNTFGQLGRDYPAPNGLENLAGETAAADGSAQPVEGVSDVVEVTGGFRFTCARRSDGRVLCWGDNRRGQLGRGTVGGYSSTPTTIPGIDDALALAVGAHFTCALRGDGAVWCWGDNSAGQLGRGPNVAGQPSGTPGPVSSLGSASAIGASSGSVCARSSGRLFCWGSNGSGQLGDGTTINRNLPVEVLGLRDPVQFTGGSAHMCATTAANGAYCWGGNANGQLVIGTGGFGQRELVPVPVVALG